MKKYLKEIKAIKDQEVFLCDIPLMTKGGSFIINGIERVVVSQMRRAPGVFFDSEDAKLFSGKVYTAKKLYQKKYAESIYAAYSLLSQLRECPDIIINAMEKGFQTK